MGRAGFEPATFLPLGFQVKSLTLFRAELPALGSFLILVLFCYHYYILYFESFKGLPVLVGIVGIFLSIGVVVFVEIFLCCG